MARRINWTRQARTDLRKISKRDSDRIERAVERFAVSGLGDIERLKGFGRSFYRLTVGGWRLRCCDEEVGMLVVQVLRCRETYRKLALAGRDISEAAGFDETRGLGDTGAI